MHIYKLTIAYDGTEYSGWQIQPNASSIQEHIQGAIKLYLRHDVALIGSGRTDAGVHAAGQVAHFKSEEEIDIHRFHRSLNGMLPRDIRILQVEQAPPDFHSQRSAYSKIYHYHLWLDPVQDPFRRRYSYHVFEPVDLSLLKKASAQFVGTHDFTTFTNEANTGCAARNPVRTIMRIDMVPEEGGVRLEFEADGFLYKMVRNIVGAVLAVAKGKRDLSEIPELFAARDRRRAPNAVPPHGLFLMHVNYKKGHVA